MVGMESAATRALAEVLGRHDVAVAYLFGSRAEGRERPDSDHDIAVLFPETAPWDATSRLAAELERALGTAVDVVDLDAVTLELRGLVAERGQLVYSTDEVRRVRFEVDARMRWIEFRPALEETSRAFLGRVAREGLR